VRERNGEYTVTLDFSCTLSTFGWAIFVLGIIFFLLGLLVLLGPAMAKGNVAQAARRALRAIED
jgi:hypothetical protein